MVTTTVEKLSPTRVKLTISVTPEELKPSIDHAYAHIAEEVSIPGFRKGKVPPPIIDQRVGRAAVLDHAINDGLDRFYRTAADEAELRPVGRPSADLLELPDITTLQGDLKIAVEVDVRPEFTLPAYDSLTLTVDEAKITDDELDAELTKLRERFGTLASVDRPAKTGDFVALDLVADIDGVEVDSASNISYELGSGELLEGIDEALDTLTAGETTTFASTLLGGDHEGETAQITVTVNSVKERELPAADDDFAQIASQFDTLDELKADLREQLGQSKLFAQGAQARDQIVEVLLEKVDIPVPEQLIEDEVREHLEGEGRLEDDAHRAEVEESSRKNFRTQMLLDAIVEQESVQVGQEELSGYIVQRAAQYGMAPDEFVKALSEAGQIPALVAEVARSKALSVVLAKAKVVDSAGKPVDVSAFTAGVLGDDRADDLGEGAPADASEAAEEETPAAEAPKPKRGRAKKADVKP